jgi:choline dehydrogenase-like flavoprotein
MGALRSPQILELSGIGNPSVLDELGITIRKSLPGVGSNLQEHPIIFLSFGRSPDSIKGGQGVETTEPLVLAVSFIELRDVVGEKYEDILVEVESYINNNKDNLEPGILLSYDILFDRLKKGSPGFELQIIDGTSLANSAQMDLDSSIQVGILLNHGWSRGSVHATSTNADDLPAVSFNFLSNPIDSKLYVSFVRFIRKLVYSEPLKSNVSITDECIPGTEFQTDEELGLWIKNHVQADWHAACSCSMLPESHNGVVNPYLKVYGTRNVRIADTSVMPIHVSAHTQAIAYALGAIAADILADCADPYFHRCDYGQLIDVNSFWC